jgi:hypothetical protein
MCVCIPGAALHDTPAWEFALGASGQRVVEVSNVTPIVDAMKIMDEGHVSAVPVFVEEPGPKSSVRLALPPLPAALARPPCYPTRAGALAWR